MADITLLWIQTGTVTLLGVLSYLIRRLISRIDSIEKDMNAMKVAFMEIKTGAVRRNGFDRHIDAIEEKITTQFQQGIHRRGELWKEVNQVKERISRIEAVQEALVKES